MTNKNQRGHAQHQHHQHNIQFAKSAIGLTAITLCLTLNTGCHDSFNPFSDDLYLTTGDLESRLHDVNVIDLNEFHQTAQNADPSSIIATPEGEISDDETFQDTINPLVQMDLTIEQCRAFALENNLELKVELLNPTITRESITEAEAAFESLFSTNLSYSKTDSPTASSLSGSSVEDTRATFGVNVPLRTGGNLNFSLPTDKFETDNSFSTLNPAYSTDFAISISQPLLRNAGVRTNTSAIRLAHYQTQSTEARTKLSVIRVLASVDRSFWRLYAFRRALVVRKEEYDLAIAQLERAQRQVVAGVAAEVEVIRAQSGVAQRLESIIIAENAVRDSERALKRILNISGLDIGSPTILVPTTEPNPVQHSLDGEQLTASALQQRMEMLELEIQLASDASTIDVRRNQVLPIVNLDYTYNVNGLGSSYSDSFEMMRDRSFEDHRVGLRVEVPLGNEAALSRLRRSLYNRLSTLATKDNRISFIRQEIFNAVDQVEANWQRILASRQNAILAARTLAAEIRQFDLGFRTSTDVLDAQAALADAQLSEIRALTEYEISQVDLAVAAGMTLGADKVRWEPTTADVG